MLQSRLWDSFRYRAPIDILVDTTIKVYDIRKANISVFREAGILDDQTYRYLYQAEKLEREIYIGNLLAANPGYSITLSEGIKEAKKKFFDLNNIQDAEVLEIDNDAVYLLSDRSVLQQVSDYVFFNDAESYTSFYTDGKLRYFYYANRITRQENLKVKGLGEYGSMVHANFMIDFLKVLFHTAQFEGSDKAIELLRHFYSQYISKSLDINFYRELNSQSGFAFVDMNTLHKIYTNIPDYHYKNIIDISYNEKILRKFNQLLASRYFKGK